MIWQGKRALITGATGFLGHELALSLMQEGASVTLLLRPGSSLDRCPAGMQDQVLVAETNVPDIVSAVLKTQPDIILHCAGRVLTDHRPEDMDDLLASNIILFSALLEAMAQAGRIRLVNIGTYLENATDGHTAPNSLYAASKRAALEILRYYQDRVPTQVITVKPSVLYGPSDPRPRLLRILIDAAVQNRRLDLSPGEQKLDLIHVADVVWAIKLAAAHLFSWNTDIVREYFAVSGNPLTLRELVTRIESLTRKPVDVNWGARPYKRSEVMYPYVHGPRVPGWSPCISLDRGIEQMIRATNEG